MVDRIEPLPIRYEAFQIQPYVDDDPVVLAMETNQGPVAVYLEWHSFQAFVEKANGALLRRQQRAGPA
jgi:hypothetical protein